MSSTRTADMIANALVFTAACIWVVSWVAPTIDGEPGLKLVSMAVLVGWSAPQLGPWAVLANITFPLAGFRIANNGKFAWPMCLTVALPAISPGFWHFLDKADADNWGPWAWTASILLLILAALFSVLCRAKGRTANTDDGRGEYADPLIKLEAIRPSTVVRLSLLTFAGIGVIFFWRWIADLHDVQTRQSVATAAALKARQQFEATHTEQGRREYVLEVINLGVTLDKYRQGKLWDVLQSGSPNASIREHDPKKYPWANTDKLGLSGGRILDALLNGAGYSVTDWGTPVFNANPPYLGKYPDSPLSPNMGLAASTESEGMSTSLFVAGPRRLTEHPDHIVEDVFAFFDSNPDVPYIVLNSDDGMLTRDMSRPPGTTPLVKDGYYVPEMPDSAALFILARRERVDPIRPFAYDDIDNYRTPMEVLNRDGVARRLFLGYLDLTKSLPRANKDSLSRPPTIPEWLEYAAKFSVRPDIRGTGQISFLDRVFNAKHRPPLDWKATPWFPIPWSKLQLQQFDNMRTLGFIHRPIFVKTTNGHGKPLSRSDARQKALMEGLQEALRTLPEGERAKGPARVIAAMNNETEQLVALERMLHKYAVQGGPEIDSGKLDQFINIDRRLGNTGAATLFIQMAIGVMGSYRAGGPSLAVNLRDPHEATFIFISPPSEEKRKAQEESGVDVFRSIKSMVPSVGSDAATAVK